MSENTVPPPTIAPTAPPRTNSAPRRACQNCWRSKAKCVQQLHTGDGKCQRCHRLSKECAPAATAPRRPRGPKTTRVAKLEQKLDGVVALLTAASQQLPRRNETPSPFGHLSTDRSSSGTPTEHRNRPVEIPSQFIGHLFIPSDPPPSLQSSFQVFSFTCDEAETLLENYRTKMVANFPFVVVPPEMTAHQLRSEKPFLFMSVMTAALYRKMTRQKQLGGEIMNYICNHVILRGEKSLELLQGILLFLAWYHYHYKPGAQQIYKVLQLAVGLLVDLGLNRSQKSNKIALEVVHHRCENIRHGDAPTTLEEDRAVAGCYYLTSTISTNFKKLNTLRLKGRIDECCRSLSAAAQYPSDRYLVQIVQLQKIADKVNQHFFGDEPDSTLPIHLGIKALQDELQAFKNALPADLSTYPLLQMHLYNLEINLHEPAIHATNLPTDIQRLKLLHNCLTSTKAYLDTYLLLTIDGLFTFTFIEWAQLSYALIILSTLSLLKDPAWDLDHVRRVVDLSQVLEQAVKRLAYAISLDGVERGGDTDTIHGVSRLMERMRTWFEIKRGGGGGAGEVSPMQCVHAVGDGIEVSETCRDAVGGAGDVVDSTEAPAPAAAVDESFLEQILGDWSELLDMEF